MVQTTGELKLLTGSVKRRSLKNREDRKIKKQEIPE